MSTQFYSFIKSDYCTECDGRGFYVEKTWTCPMTGKVNQDLEQCFECEELHQMEVRADIYQDKDID